MEECANSRKVTDIEKSMIKLETTLSGFADNMSDKMGTMAAQMSAMSKTLSNLAVAEEKINQLEVDMRNIANIHRHDISELHNKINVSNDKVTELAKAHSDECDAKTSDLQQHMEDRGGERLSMGLKLSFGAMGILWGITSLIFWALFNSWSKTADETNKIVKENQLMIRSNSGKFEIVDNRVEAIIKDIDNIIKKKL